MSKLTLGSGNWATKESKLLTTKVNDSGTFIPLPFDFSRGSDGTYVDRNGIIQTAGINQPRIDFSDNVAGSLLLEPQSENLIPNSIDFIAGWDYQSMSIFPNDETSPDSSLTGTRISTTNGNASLYNNINVLSNQTYTFSFYAKIPTTGALSTPRIAIYDNTNSEFIEVDIFYSPTTEWKRFSFTFTTSANTASIRCYPIRETATIGDLFFWGSQLEQLNSKTSYIPTNGSTVVRLADSCVNAGDVNSFNSLQGSLSVRASALSDDLTNRLIGLWDGTQDNMVYVGYSTVSNEIVCGVRVGGVDQFTAAQTVSDITEFHTIKVVYSESYFTFSIDGVIYKTQLSGDIFPEGTLQALTTWFGIGTEPFYSKILSIETNEQII